MKEMTGKRNQNSLGGFKIIADESSHTSLGRNETIKAKSLLSLIIESSLGCVYSVGISTLRDRYS